MVVGCVMKVSRDGGGGGGLHTQIVDIKLIRTRISIYLDGIFGSGCGLGLAVVLLILEKRSRITCSFCSHVKSDISTFSPTASLHHIIYT